MSLTTRSQFFFGHIVDETNRSLDFAEGGPEIQASLTPGDYTLTEFAVEIGDQMTNEGTQEYTVSIDRDTRILTISATSDFELLIGTGSRVGSGSWTLMGFTGVLDLTGTNSYSGDSGSGQVYQPQFILQDHIDPADWQEDVDSRVNESASGLIQVTRFGTRTFLQLNIKFITNLTQGVDSPIENNANGVSQAQNFLSFSRTKSRMEFMEDRDTASSFIKVLLEKTPSQRDGTGFKLLEQFSRGLPGYFESGKLKFRTVT